MRPTTEMEMEKGRERELEPNSQDFPHVALRMLPRIALALMATSGYGASTMVAINTMTPSKACTCPRSMTTTLEKKMDAAFKDKKK